AETITAMCREAAAAAPEAIAIYCTNLRGAPLAGRLTQELAVPVYDSVAVTVWDSLRRCRTVDEFVVWSSLT
ncbi:MAG: hypothetical protein QGF53_06165, partial [Alphaproteobacteria bacterium]|nr:hypothetical protein [Alphaproteobacteria bacterium]